MKYSFYPHTNAQNISSDTEAIHLVRPVKKEKLQKLLRKCPNLKEISLSISCEKRLSSEIKKFLKQKGIALLSEESRGRAIEISMEKMLKAIEMNKDRRPLREIEVTIGIPKSTVHYLVKYADRKKIKSGKETLHLT